MDITNRSITGYTFWIVTSIRSADEYHRLVSRIESEGYKLSQIDTFIILDERSKEFIPPSDYVEIHTDILINNDSAIYSIIHTMGRKPVVVLTGDKEIAYSSFSKRSLAMMITRYMGDTVCTLISEPLSVVNTMRDHTWISLIGNTPSVGLSNRAISVLRGVQFSKGEPITDLYRLSSYILSCLNWEDPSLVIAGAAHISEISHSQLENILSQGKSCKGENTWDIHGYMIIRVDKIYGYNLNTRGLPSILSSLGCKGFKLYSILLDTKE